MKRRHIEEYNKRIEVVKKEIQNQKKLEALAEQELTRIQQEMKTLDD